MAHFSKAQLASILEMTHITSEMVNKHEQKQTQPKCYKPIKEIKRPRVRHKEYVPITSSDPRRAFMMNEYRINHPEKYVEKRVAYYKFFGKEVIIKDKEIKVFIKHGVTIYYK